MAPESCQPLNPKSEEADSQLWIKGKKKAVEDRSGTEFGCGYVVWNSSIILVALFHNELQVHPPIKNVYSSIIHFVVYNYIEKVTS